VTSIIRASFRRDGDAELGGGNVVEIEDQPDVDVGIVEGCADRTGPRPASGGMALKRCV